MKGSPSSSLALLLALTGGCADPAAPEPPFPGSRVWQSEHFSYHSYEEDDSVCEAVLARLEHHFHETQAYLGTVWPNGKKVSYFKYPNEAELSRAGKCQTNTAACAIGLSVHTTERAHSHELIHAYFNVDGRERIAFLDEGLAEVMSCERAQEVQAPPWREIVAQEPDPARLVGRSGAWLVGHLLARYPRDEFLRWSSRVERGATATQIGAEFDAVYGLSLDSVWREVTELAGKHVQCVMLEECGAEPLVLDGSVSTVGAGCDGGNRFRTIDVSEPTNLVLQQDVPALNQLSSCDDVPMLVSLLSRSSVDEPEATLVHLEPGKYTFGVSSYEPEAEVQVRGRSAPELELGSTCDASAAFLFEERLFGESVSATLTLPPGAAGDAWFARFAPGPDHYFEVENGNAKLATSQCVGCSDECVPTQSQLALPLDDQGAATLRVERLEPSESPSRVVVVWRQR